MGNSVSLEKSTKIAGPPEFIHIYSTGKGYREPADTAPKYAAAHGARAIAAGSINDLKKIFTDLFDANTKISRLLIETHGSPGAVYFGHESLDKASLSRFKSNNFEHLFADNARIFLNGCNIAKIGTECSEISCVTVNGRHFLEEIARTFLIAGGGRVGASTSLGRPTPFSDKIFHVPLFESSDTVYAYINKGGSKVRIAVGYELKEPEGHWIVEADGVQYSYRFLPGSKSVTWNDNQVWNRQSGKGNWQIKDDLMIINWESGSTEEWDLPLFSQEQTITWKKPDGRIQKILARFQIKQAQE